MVLIRNAQGIQLSKSGRIWYGVFEISWVFLLDTSLLYWYPYNLFKRDIGLLKEQCHTLWDKQIRTDEKHTCPKTGHISLGRSKYYTMGLWNSVHYRMEERKEPLLLKHYKADLCHCWLWHVRLTIHSCFFFLRREATVSFCGNNSDHWAP